MSRQLFIAGCGRSGTTALTEYLNDHPQICICVERYKFIPKQVAPELLTFERILKYSTGETNLPEARHQELLARKDERELKWVGDKVPSYFQHLDTLAANNPDGAILFTYRPLQSIAASYAERSRNPKDAWLGGKDGIGIAIRDWNGANRAFKRFCTSHPTYPILGINYDEFFANPKRSAGTLSKFLGIDLGPEIVARWREKNAQFSEKGTDKPLTEKEQERLEGGRDQRTANWVLGYLAAQRRWSMSTKERASKIAPSLSLRVKKRVKGLLKRIDEIKPRG